MSTKNVLIEVTIHKEDDGRYTAEETGYEDPVASFGDSPEEALESLQEAVTGYIKSKN